MTEPSPWHLTHTPQDANGNVGMIQILGFFASAEDARADGEMYARATGATNHLHWREFSSTTWGLMNGQVYTHILLSRVGEVAS